MTLDDLMELVLQAAHSAANMGYNTREVTVDQLNTKNQPPTLTLDTVAKGDVPSIRLISIL